MGGVTATLAVTSDDFADGGGLPATFAGGQAGCPGDNVNPQLSWSPGPAGTTSYVIALVDPDARNYSHWLHVDIPPNVVGVARGASASLPGTTGRGTNGTSAYFGPCPPSRHHYVFTVYALKTDRLELPPDATAALAGFMINANALGKASFTALYGRPAQ